jgi:hypothetical protein
MGIKLTLWKCKCGVDLKAVTTTDDGQEPVSLQAECPRCGHEQTLKANQIISVSVDKTHNTLFSDSSR